MLHVPVLSKLDFDGRIESLPGKMREYRRPSLSVIDEANNNETDNNCLAPAITVTSVDDIDDEETSSICSSRSGSETDLVHLKLTTTRLRLTTRRPSIVEWKEYVEMPRRRSKPDLRVVNDDGNDSLTDDRKEKINDALAWIKSELREMRSQDQHLARKLLSIRQDIHKLKLKRSCQEHKEMLEDVATDLEELNKIKDICDMPHDSFENPLKHLGVTSYNLTARRFSTC